MVLLNFWILFGFIPLYFIYKKQINKQNNRQIRLLYLSLAFMLFAFSRPALQNSLNNEKFNSQDYIIAIDASYSMQANDIKPTRYIMAKKAIKKLLKLHKKDRFSIFAFTSNTLLISPPTTDTDISMQALNALNPKYILTKSTNLYNLFKTISKTSFKKKNLIIFSDGGDDQKVEKIVKLAKKDNIVVYFVVTATQKGSALKKDGSYIKNTHSELVISRINPIIKDLVKLTNGKYYELNSLSVINKLSNDISKEDAVKKQNIKVQNYKELFYIPLIISIFLYFISVTKLHQLYVIIPLLFFLPDKAIAGILDFYHLGSAKKDYKEKKYIEATKEFIEVTPSVKSYYNIANSYYKKGNYKIALSYYAKIRTHNKNVKQNIFYNMGNCAVKIKKYDKAIQFYIYALVLGPDKDALYNLNLLKKLHLKTSIDVSKMLIHKNTQTKKQSSKTNHKQKNNKKSSSSSSNSNRNATQSTNGKGGDKKKKKSNVSKKNSKTNNYKMSYKVYEKINKGYSDEKQPW